MLLNLCPTPDHLRRFLDQQLDAAEQAETETHVDACRSCQATLEELTRRHAYNLCGLNTDLSTAATDQGADP